MTTICKYDKIGIPYLSVLLFCIILTTSGCTELYVNMIDGIVDGTVDSAINKAFETEEERQVRKDKERLCNGEPLEHHRDKKHLIQHSTDLWKRGKKEEWKTEEYKRLYEVDKKLKEPVLINTEESDKDLHQPEEGE